MRDIKRVGDCHMTSQRSMDPISWHLFRWGIRQGSIALLNTNSVSSFDVMPIGWEMVNPPLRLDANSTLCLSFGMLWHSCSAHVRITHFTNWHYLPLSAFALLSRPFGLIRPSELILLRHVTVPCPPWYYMSNLTLTSHALATNCVLINVPLTPQMARLLADALRDGSFFVDEHLWERWKDGSSTATHPPHTKLLILALLFKLWTTFSN